MIKCSHKSCIEPVFKDGFCETHYEHEQRILERQARVEAQLKAHGINGGVLRKLGSVPPPANIDRPREDARANPVTNRLCMVTGCRYQARDLVLCEGCLNLYQLWRRYRQQNKPSPMTPTPQQQKVYDQLYELAFQPPRHP